MDNIPATLMRIKVAINPTCFAALKILLRLGDQTPLQLSKKLDVEYSGINHYLLRMRNLGLVQSYQFGKHSFYKVSKPNKIAGLIELVSEWMEEQ